MKFPAVLLILLGSLSFVMGQTTFTEQAARLQNINAYLLDLRPVSDPARPDRSQIELGLDITPQPDIDTTIGRKEEPLDPPSAVPRLRLRYLSQSGFFAGGTYVPGLEFQDYEADYWAAELGYRFRFRQLHAAVRVSAGDGDVTGPITENDASDFFQFSSRGADISAGIPFRSFHFYGFAGAADIETELDIEADGVNLDNEDDAIYGGLGVSWRGKRWGVTIEQNATDSYLKHIVLNLSYRL